MHAVACILLCLLAYGWIQLFFVCAKIPWMVRFLCFQIFFFSYHQKGYIWNCLCGLYARKFIYAGCKLSHPSWKLFIFSLCVWVLRSGCFFFWYTRRNSKHSFVYDENELYLTRIWLHGQKVRYRRNDGGWLKRFHNK